MAQTPFHDPGQDPSARKHLATTSAVPAEPLHTHPAAVPLSEQVKCDQAVAARCRQLVPPPERKNALQDLRCHMLQKPEPFKEMWEREPRGYLGYLLQSARHLWIDTARKGGRRFREQALDLEVLDRVQCDQGQDPEPESVVEQAIRTEDAGRLTAALKQLAESEQVLIRLRHWERLSFEEIGLHLRCSADGARTAHMRILDKLFRLLSKGSRVRKSRHGARADKRK